MYIKRHAVVRGAKRYVYLRLVQAYRDEHRQHHLNLWDPTGDPKVSRLVWLGLVKPDSRRVPFLWKHVVLPLTLHYSPRNVVAAARSSTKRVGRLTLVGTVAALAILTGAEREVALYWIVPYVSTFQVLRYWAEMAEHSGLESDRPWTATRSWTAAWPMRWLIAPHSDHWHLAHHLYSKVPHYRLGKAHQILMRVPQYADEGHHCDGLFFAHRPDAPSVISDLMHPEAIVSYRAKRAASGSFIDFLGQR